MTKIVQSYKRAILYSTQHWKLILILFCANLGFSMVLIYPVQSWLNDVLSKSESIYSVANSFDLNVIMDVLHSNKNITSLLLPLVLIVSIFYFFWLNFALGGIVGSVKKSSFKLVDFFSSGSLYFFKNIRISLYTILIYLILIGLSFAYFTKDGLNVLKIDSEVFLINRFYGLMVLLLILFFLVGIFRDLCRVNCLSSDNNYLWQSNILAFRKSFTLSAILLALLNIFVLAVIVIIHFYITQYKIYDLNFLVSLLLGQVFIVSRMILMVTRLSSFYYLEN